MIAGMTIANLFGVPLGTSLSTLLSWRLTFMLVGVWGIIILYYIWKWVPQVEGLPDTGFKGQFRFLKTGAPWLILGATMLGNGGVFCWYSYINPLLTKVSGFSTESITLLMVLAGFGMVVGNLLGGKLSDKYTPGRVAASTQFILFTALLGIFFVAISTGSQPCSCAFVQPDCSLCRVLNKSLSFTLPKEASYWEQPVYKWLSISAMPSAHISEVYPCKPD